MYPILQIYDPELPTRIDVDTSGFATGRILLQEQTDDNKWHPITYLSKSMIPAEHNYDIYNKEMLAII